MVRDMLQVGQGLPAGRTHPDPDAGRRADPAAGASTAKPTLHRGADRQRRDVRAPSIPGPGRARSSSPGQPTKDMITTLAADSSFDSAGTADARSPDNSTDG